MLLWLTVFVCVLLLAVLAVNMPPFALFVWRLRQRPVLLPDDSLPNAAVILCLRGADSTLERCIEGLLSQDYPRYEVVIVVDHVDDPAWEMAQRIVPRFSKARVRLEMLANPSETCSLKCSSLLQAISGLDESIEVFAFLDVDTTPYPDWLRELVSPLTIDGIGATTGARWFMPQQPTWSSIVRYQWGLAAVLTCNALGIAWGGTLAIRRDAFQRAGLKEKWAGAYCEDTMIPMAIRPLGLRLQYLPHMVMVNRDSCSLHGFFEWCTRQMLTTRLYHRRAWRLVIAHALVSALAWIAPVILAVWAIGVQDWTSAIGLCLLLAVFWIAQWLAMLVLEITARRVVRSRGEPANWLKGRALWRTLIGIPFTQFMYLGVMLAAMRTRRVCWRGILYEIAGPFQVRMNSYRRYVPDSAVSAPPTASGPNPA